MNTDRPKSYLPWIFFAIALLGCLTLGLFLIGALTLNLLSPDSGDYSSSGELAIVEIEGAISSPKEIISALRKIEKSKKVKALILRVNSPGGEVAPSQEIHDLIVKIKRNKKVVVSMGSLAASGGYYVSVPAHRIVANPGTITGSIGVVLQMLVAKDLLKKLYLDFRVIKSGEVKDMGSPLRNLTPKEIKILQDLSNNIHDQFINAVAKGRKLKVEEVRALADGRIFSGEQALKLKLVDELGGLDRAIEVAAKLAHIKGDPEIYYPLRKKKRVWDIIAEGVASAISNTITSAVTATGQLPKPMYLYGR